MARDPVHSCQTAQKIAASVRLAEWRAAGCSEWDEKKRQEFLLRELENKRPLVSKDLQPSPEVADVLNTFKTLAELPPDSLAAYVISMAHTASDVLAVVLLQVTHRSPHALF